MNTSEGQSKENKMTTFTQRYISHAVSMIDATPVADRPAIIAEIIKGIDGSIAKGDQRYTDIRRFMATI